MTSELKGPKAFEILTALERPSAPTAGFNPVASVSHSNVNYCAIDVGVLTQAGGGLAFAEKLIGS